LAVKKEQLNHKAETPPTPLLSICFLLFLVYYYFLEVPFYRMFPAHCALSLFTVVVEVKDFQLYTVYI
jgi:hypothetical protein